MAREMKNSGVEWIGEIPKEWKAPKLKYLLTLVNGRAYKDDEFEESGIYPVLRVGNLFTNPKWYYSSLELEPSKYCDSGDLLYAWSASYGPYIWNGGKVIYHYHIWKVIVDNKYMKKYAFYVMQSLTHSISSQSHGTAMTHVTMEAMNNQCIPHPQKSEQIRIANFLDCECGEIDAVLEKTRASIEEYKKLKQAVITQAVTKGVRPNRPMKDSGIAWIGEMPKDWRVIAFKYVMHKGKKICEHYTDENIISLTMGGVVKRDLTAGGKMPASFDGYQYVEPGDLLLCLFDIDVTPRCVGLVKDKGVTSPAYSCFKLHNGFVNA